MMKINSYWKTFEELTTSELYAVLQLRAAIFVVEQNCPYQDLDGKDLKSHHLLCFDNERLIGTARVLPPDVSYPGAASIGRIVVATDQRGTKLGRAVVESSIEKVRAIWGEIPLLIGAQARLQGFYESLGFASEGEVYDEDGIDHITMRWNSVATLG